jgi:Ras-related protein Rab-5C
MQKIKEAKVVIVGDMGVGKTSLAVRYSTEKFSNFQESTLGAAYIEKIQKT